MAPVGQYLIADKAAEIALARSAATFSVSDGAEVMIPGKDEYTTAMHGNNGFVCVVERAWGAGTTDSEFWNPKVRPPCPLQSSRRAELPARVPFEDQVGVAGDIQGGDAAAHRRRIQQDNCRRTYRLCATACPQSHLAPAGSPRTSSAPRL